MSVLKGERKGKYIEGRENSQMDVIFENGERLFNMLAATYANAGVLSAFFKGGNATDKAMAEEAVSVYEDLKQMCLDYDDTIRHQTEVIDKMSKELDEMHKLIKYMDEKQKRNYEQIREDLKKLDKSTAKENKTNKD